MNENLAPLDKQVKISLPASVAPNKNEAFVIPSFKTRVCK
jgi:hypothetical protein